MNLQHLPDDPRLLELLAGRVIGDLDGAEQAELDGLAASHGIDLTSMDYSMLDIAAGTVALAGASGEPAPPLPAALRDRLMAAADEFIVREGAVAGRIEREAAGRPGWMLWGGWLAAAAGIMLAAIAWWGTRGGAMTGGAATISELVASAPDVRRAAWGDWDQPEIEGVRGEVVWSDSRQIGFMRFTGLPANDVTREQYQLWIVDERGLADASGQSARISGGVFDVKPDANGEVVVPISAAIKVGKAQLFALTIEKPGGTWVSDMKRRVVIAKVAG